MSSITFQLILLTPQDRNSTYHLQMLELQLCAAMPGFLDGIWGLNLGPSACVANILLTELSHGCILMSVELCHL